MQLRDTLFNSLCNLSAVITWPNLGECEPITFWCRQPAWRLGTARYHFIIFLSIVSCLKEKCNYISW
jgi:hypothetical protein